MVDTNTVVVVQKEGSDEKKDDDTSCSVVAPPPDAKTTTTTTTKVSLSLGKKKKKKTKKTSSGGSGSGNYNQNVLGHEERRDTTSLVDVATDHTSTKKEPLVIPVASNQLRWKQQQQQPPAAAADVDTTAETTTTETTSQKQQSLLSVEDIQALQALQQAAGDTSASDNNNKKKLVIPSVSVSSSTNKATTTTTTSTTATATTTTHDTTTTELQQYQTDLAELPDALTEESESYRQVPIAEFGAAMLRGMGWKGDDDNDKSKKNKDDDTMQLPRPHRLGLGATPKLAESSSQLASSSISGRKLLKRPDQYRKQLALDQQKQVYQKQREQQIAMDKQRTLQDGSLVYIISINLTTDTAAGHDTTTTTTTRKQPRRARILQLVGVPGLNRVKIQYENEVEPTIVKRGEIGELISRDDLEQEPFQEAKAAVLPKLERTDNDSSKKEKSKSRAKDNEGRKRRPSDKYEGDRKRKRHESATSSNDHDDDDRHHRSSSSKRSRDERPQWAIPHIRVRVVTEKLGRRYYKEKCMVIDCTPKGVTVQTPTGTVLDRVPERYLETALPKAGGPVVVLSSGQHRHAKGRLLERSSRDGTGVIQFFEDMNVMTLSLDDMAEWCGPLDDDLHE